MEIYRRNFCENCGQAIELIDLQPDMWLHTVSRKVSCELYATPIPD